MTNPNSPASTAAGLPETDSRSEFEAWAVEYFGRSSAVWRRPLIGDYFYCESDWQAWQARERSFIGPRWDFEAGGGLIRAEAEAQISALRDELDALKATRPNIDACMALAGAMVQRQSEASDCAHRGTPAEYDESLKAVSAAREALCAELAKGMP